MKISTQTDTLGRRLSDEEAIRIICDSGFDAIDYSMFGIVSKPDHILNTDGMEAYVLNLKQIAEKNGVYFNQAHAPFPSMKANDEEYNSLVFSRIVRSMEVASLLGIKHIIVHPVHISEDEEVDFRENVKFYNSLIPYIQKYSVKVATENMYGRNRDGYYPLACGTAESFVRLMDALDERYFVACLDIGHCGMVGQKPADMIRALGKKYLHALHVHDNDNLRDAHIFPFNGTVDWFGVTAALAEIDYDGELTFEADASMYNCPDYFLPTAEKHLHDIGVALNRMYEESKKAD